MVVLSRFSPGLGTLSTTNEGWIFDAKPQSQAERGRRGLLSHLGFAIETPQRF